MVSSGRKVLYFFTLLIIPFLLWIIPQTKIHFITFLLILLLYIVSRYWKEISFLHDGLEIILLYLTLSFLLNEIGLDNLFPANVLIIIILLYLFLFRLKKWDRARLFLIRGNIKKTLGIVILFSMLSIVSLVIWFIFQKENAYAKFIPELPIPILLPLGIGFGIINGFYEEGLSRSILLSHFTEQIGFKGAMLLQSFWFSFLHYQSGFPSGIIGIGLTFVFGLMMGYLVYRTKGLLVPIVIHVLADFTIFILVILRIHNMI